MKKPSQFTLELLKEKELEKGEPYDREVAQGLHPEHEQDLLNVIARHQDTQSKEVKKKVAKALVVKWGDKEASSESEESWGDQTTNRTNPVPEAVGLASELPGPSPRTPPESPAKF